MFRYLYILLFFINFDLFSQEDPIPGEEAPALPKDSIIIFQSPRSLINEKLLNNNQKNGVGMSVAFSTYGFALGGFYHRKVSEKVDFVSFTFISNARATDEIPIFDFARNLQFIPGKINRLLFMPYMAGFRYNILADKIVNNFKPFVGGGGGGALILSTPYLEGRSLNGEFVGFFESFGDANWYFRPGAFLELGAEFNMGLGAISSLNFRYHYIPFGGDGLESVAGAPVDIFGEFFISLNIGKKF